MAGIYIMSFQSPSKIQAIVLHHLLGSPPSKFEFFQYNCLRVSTALGNVIAQSQSGTGKTAVFSIAIISRINPSIQSPQALILASTNELVRHIGSVIEEMTQFLTYIRVARRNLI